MKKIRGANQRKGNYIERKMYDDWIKKVRLRDGNKCVLCRKKWSLQVHHIQTWANNPLLRYDENNGVCLCLECHRSTFHHEEQFAALFHSHVLNIKNGKTPKADANFLLDIYIKAKYGENNDS